VNVLPWPATRTAAALAADPAPASPPSPARALTQMLLGNQLQQAIYVAAKLGVADQLHDGPRGCEELATATGAHPASLYRLLRALAGFGIFEEDPEGRFSLTPSASLLQSETPQSVRSFALWSGGVSYQAFGGLEESVRTGRPAFERLFGTEFFSYLADHPESGAVFDEMMARHTAPVTSAIAAYEFPAAGTVVDVGGGRGQVLASVLRANPGLRGVLVDQPRVLEQARQVLRAAGVGDRCTVEGADVLREVPPGDAYILKSVVHGMCDDDAVLVLRNCRRAIGREGVLLLVEFVIPPGNEPFPSKMMDLLMLVGCYGRERTEPEFGTLLAAADFRLARVLPTKYGYSIVECRPA
jgi:hypothetical protein